MQLPDRIDGSYSDWLHTLDDNAGLRDLVDFLPATMAVIISYFSAEVTRGIWKPVPMNGTDWPSPAANLLSIESEMNEILASAGVTASNFYPGMVPCYFNFILGNRHLKKLKNYYLKQSDLHIRCFRCQWQHW